MTPDRSPVILKRRPQCYGAFDCCSVSSTCSWAEKCEKFSFTTVTTLADKANSKKEHTEHDVASLLNYARKKYQAVTGKKVYWRSDKWTDTIDKILLYCEQETVDPEAYIDAQIESLATWFIHKGKEFYSNIMLGKKAYLRYLTYLAKAANRGRTFQISVEEANKENDTIEAHFLFATSFILMNMTFDEARKEVRRSYPTFEPDRGKPSLRSRALSRFLNRFYLKSANKWLTVQDEKWKWEDAKKLVKDTLENEKEKFKKKDFNSELGVLI